MTSRPGREQEKDWKWTRKASDCQLAFDCDTAIIQGPAQRCRLDKCLKLALDSRKHILTLAGALGVHLPGPHPQRFGNGTHSSTLAWKIPWMEGFSDCRLVGCSPWGREGSDRTERLHFHVSLSCMGEGNGNALQCSCLENPRGGGAWWAAVYGVTQSRT